MWLDAVKAAASSFPVGMNRCQEQPNVNPLHAVFLPYLALVCCKTDLEGNENIVSLLDHERLAQQLGMFRYMVEAT